MTNSTENQNSFKIGDEIRLIRIHKIQNIDPSSKELFISTDGWVDPDYYELVPPKPVYPNPPDKHCDIICHVANGGIARNLKTLNTINKLGGTNWGSDNIYEIVQPKTEDELRVEKRIEVLENRLRKDQQEIDFTKKELARLNPNVHY